VAEAIVRHSKRADDLEPLLVRELQERNYQVVIGARRLRAGRIAELDAIPVRVVKLTDAEAIKAQVVELSVVGKSFLR
jgi:ParB/RepB/Spo0J family partition protein